MEQAPRRRQVAEWLDPEPRLRDSIVVAHVDPIVGRPRSGAAPDCHSVLLATACAA